LSDNLASIVDDLIDHVTVLKELGQRSVQMNPQIVRDLTRKTETESRKEVESAPLAPPEEVKKREPLSEAILRNSQPLPLEERRKAMRKLQHEMNRCFDCNLCKNRSKAVAGEGKLDSPDVMFIGPAPDSADDKSGRAFSGPAGELLTKMIEAMGYTREDVFLTNTCKCPTPRDRAPIMKEMENCGHFLEDQIRIVRPKVIVVLGEHANKGLFHNHRTASQPQGVWTKYHGIPVMPTFHPKYILRFSNDAEGQQMDLKRSVWKALKAVMQLLGK
jgi:DNA polymerase